MEDFKCPHPTKLRFLTKNEAKKFIKKTEIEILRKSKVKLRAYLCKCGFYHVTSETKVY